MKLFTAILVIFIVIFPAVAGGQNEVSPEKEMNREPVPAGALDNGMMEGAMDGAMMSGGSMGPLLDFIDMDDAKNLALLGPTVLFFAADWCPSCQSAKADFEANVMELEDVALLVVNYDDSQALQQRFGVTYQHTFVQINAQGEALHKWNGGGTKKLLAELMEGDM